MYFNGKTRVSKEAATGGVLRKKIRNIHWKTSVLESPAQVFSSEYCETFKNTYFEEHLRAAASVYRGIRTDTYFFHTSYFFCLKIFCHIHVRFQFLTFLKC